MPSRLYDWMEAEPPSQSINEGLKWLRDWCGLKLPVRGALSRPWRGLSSSSSNDKESLSLHGLE